MFKGSFFKQKDATFTRPNIFFYNLNSDFTVKDCLFRGVKIAKNPDPDKHVYSSYGIGFD